ncbi:MAG: 50S ribosomal protein L10 [Proteobacteria bacterium]|nr:50S ribosomal protein L10 [Pseudomonadota bacterium]
MSDRALKENTVAELRKRFSEASTLVLLDFCGLDVASATDLRTQFRAAGVDYSVAKNTLIRRALQGTPLENQADLELHLKGPTAIACSYEDPSAAAKVVKAFRQDEARAKKLRVKCGVFEARVMPGERVERELATMPGKDEARALLLAQLQAPAQSLARQLGAPAQRFVYALDARVRQQQGGG